MTIHLPYIDGMLIAERRHALHLSRNAFAQLVNMRPGAIWRLEVRNVFKPGEHEYLLGIADRWLTNDIAQSTPVISRASKSTSVRTTTKHILPAVEEDTASQDLSEEDLDLVQWIDVCKLDTHRRAQLVYPLNAVSPTILSAQDGIQRISNSEVQTFKRCRRKWWLAYVRGLRQLYTKPYGACAIGVHGHAALAAWYQPEDHQCIHPCDALEIIIDIERAHLNTLPNIDEVTIHQFNRDVELERIILEGYMQWVHDTGADAEYSIIGSEQYLEADVPNMQNIRIIARLDARVVRTYDKARLFIDHKFVASIPQATRLLSLNEQMQWYILLEELQQSHDPTQRVDGAVYNMLRRCKRSAKAQPPFYQRITVHHSNIEIASFHKRLIGTLQNMQSCRQELTTNAQSYQYVVYPTPTRDCAWDCPFIQVCPMVDDNSRFEDALAEHYVIGDPYGYYGSPILHAEE